MRGLSLLVVVVGLVAAGCPQAIKETVYAPHEIDPTRYYLCEPDMQEILSCAKGFTFDVNTQKCSSRRITLMKNYNEDSKENYIENDENSRGNDSSGPIPREYNNSRKR